MGEERRTAAGVAERPEFAGQGKGHEAGAAMAAADAAHQPTETIMFWPPLKAAMKSRTSAGLWE